MNLKRYRFDCTKVPASDILKVENLLEHKSETGASSNYQKEPRIYYVFFSEDLNVQKWIDENPSLIPCTFREVPPC